MKAKIISRKAANAAKVCLACLAPLRDMAPPEQVPKHERKNHFSQRRKDRKGLLGVLCAFARYGSPEQVHQT
jgi:hypothetical protein